MNFLKRLLFIALSLAFLVQGMGNLFICLEFKLNLTYLERYVCIERGIPNSKCKAHCRLKKQCRTLEGLNKFVKIHQLLSKYMYYSQALFNKKPRHFYGGAVYNKLNLI